MEALVMTLEELMALPPAERALAASLSVKAPMPQTEGAWPAGTPVRKCNSSPGEFHPDGALATVVGSLWVCPVDREIIRLQNRREVSYFYLVVFSDMGIPVALFDDKLQLADG